MQPNLTMAQPCATLLCDVDGVIADIHPIWLEFYNADYGDDKTVDDITCWDMHECVKPECGRGIYDYLRDPRLYNWTRPVPGALDAVRELRAMGVRVVFVSATVTAQMENKPRWLVRHQFTVELSGYTAEYIPTVDKDLIHGDFLVDDCLANLE
ncbi:MAG: hypothetical protein EOO39_22875, partial [Cytophagaceae bacterium]